MAHTKTKLKFSLDFWQLFLVLVLAVALGTIVAVYSYGNIVQDEIGSISFMEAARQKTETKTPVKKPVTPKYIKK